MTPPDIAVTERDREAATKIADIMRVNWVHEDDEAAHLTDIAAHALATARAEGAKEEQRECIAALDGLFVVSYLGSGDIERVIRSAKSMIRMARAPKEVPSD